MRLVLQFVHMAKERCESKYFLAWPKQTCICHDIIRLRCTDQLSANGDKQKQPANYVEGSWHPLKKLKHNWLDTTVLTY